MSIARAAGVRDEIVGGEAFEIAVNASERPIGHGAAALQGRLEGQQPRAGIGRRTRPIHKAHALARQLQVVPEPDRFGGRRRAARGGQRPVEHPRDRPGMSKVFPHQTLDALLRLRPREPEDVRRELLERMTQDIRVPAALQVQNRADAQQEILGLVQPPFVEPAIADAAAFSEQHADPVNSGNVAQPARRFLDVGLELIERVVELGVTPLQKRPKQIEHRLVHVPGPAAAVASARL